MRSKKKSNRDDKCNSRFKSFIIVSMSKHNTAIQEEWNINKSSRFLCFFAVELVQWFKHVYRRNGDYLWTVAFFILVTCDATKWKIVTIRESPCTSAWIFVIKLLLSSAFLLWNRRVQPILKKNVKYISNQTIFGVYFTVCDPFIPVMLTK